MAPLCSRQKPMGVPGRATLLAIRKIETQGAGGDEHPAEEQAETAADAGLDGTGDHRQPEHDEHDREHDRGLPPHAARFPAAISTRHGDSRST